MSDRKNKAWVLMAWPYDEIWGPVAIFTDYEEGKAAERILQTRLHGKADYDEEGRAIGWEYPRFHLRELLLNPEVVDTGDRRVIHQDANDEAEGEFQYASDWCEFDDEWSVYYTAQDINGDDKSNYRLETEVQT